MRRNLIRAAAVLSVVGVISLFVWGIAASGREQAAWERWCREQGGTVTDSTKVSTSVGVSSNGKPVTVVSTSTTYYCLNDGRVLGVR